MIYNKINDIIFVNAKTDNDKVLYDIALFSDGEIIEKKLNFNKFELQEFYKILENETINMWKGLNQIQNTNINLINCRINYFNMLELKEITNNLKNISVIQNILIKSMSYKSIEYDIFYYGNLQLLFKIFNLNNLKINESQNYCNIRLK